MDTNTLKDAAVFSYKIRASTGYQAEGSYPNITPNQYRQVVAALEGTLKEVNPVQQEHLLTTLMQLSIMCRIADVDQKIINFIEKMIQKISPAAAQAKQADPEEVPMLVRNAGAL